MTGGYKIIDLEGLDLANIQLDSTKIEKIFSDIESTYKTKALLFDNYKINGIEQNATFSSAIVKNSGFEITLGDYKILIKNNSVEDTSIHLYRHTINVELTDLSGHEGYLYFNLYNTYKNEINTIQDIINNDKYDTGVAGYIDDGTNTYPNIYFLSIRKDSVIIAYNDTEVTISIVSFTDIITQIF